MKRLTTVYDPHSTDNTIAWLEEDDDPDDEVARDSSILIDTSQAMSPEDDELENHGM